MPPIMCPRNLSTPSATSRRRRRGRRSWRKADSERVTRATRRSPTCETTSVSRHQGAGRLALTARVGMGSFQSISSSRSQESSRSWIPRGPMSSASTPSSRTRYSRKRATSSVEFGCPEGDPCPRAVRSRDDCAGRGQSAGRRFQLGRGAEVRRDVAVRILEAVGREPQGDTMTSQRELKSCFWLIGFLLSGCESKDAPVPRAKPAPPALLGERSESTIRHLASHCPHLVSDAGAATAISRRESGTTSRSSSTIGGTSSRSRTSMFGSDREIVEIFDRHIAPLMPSVSSEALRRSILEPEASFVLRGGRDSGNGPGQTGSPIRIQESQLVARDLVTERSLRA